VFDGIKGEELALIGLIAMKRQCKIIPDASQTETRINAPLTKLRCGDPKTAQ